MTSIPCRRLIASGLFYLQIALVAPAFGGARSWDVVDLRKAASWSARSEGVAFAGDANGDGYGDAALGSCSADRGAGRVRVVWGPFDDGVADDEASGYSIYGAGPEDEACHLTTAPAGDLNGDGLDDLAIGAPLAGPPGRSPTGTVYVIFGKATEEDVDLASFDTNTQGNAGFRIDGPSGFALAGSDLDGIGDMNLDGLDDIVLGAPFDGATYVVFGKVAPTPVDLGTFALGRSSEGFRIRTYGPDFNDGYAVAGAGDVNGDGVPDVVVGVVPNVRQSTGSAFVVFGKSDSAPVDTRVRSELSFKIKGVVEGESTGSAVGGAGDVNGDGLDDVVVGAPKNYSCCRGRAAVIFGKANTREVSIGDLGRQGFKIAAAQDGDSFGYSVTGVGDVDSDGLDDLAVGAPWLRYRNRGRPGGVFVVYGKRSVDKVRTGRLRRAGFVIVGRSSGDLTGAALARPGDIDEDGDLDLMISAPTGGKTYLLALDPRRGGS